MEDEIPLVPEMSDEEKQILADLEREQADAETKEVTPESPVPPVLDTSTEALPTFGALLSDAPPVEDTELKDRIHSYLESKSALRLGDHHMECRPKQVHKHLHELADQLKEFACEYEHVHVRVTIDPVA